MDMQLFSWYTSVIHYVMTVLLTDEFCTTGICFHTTQLFEGYLLVLAVDQRNSITWTGDELVPMTLFQPMFIRPWCFQPNTSVILDTWYIYVISYLWPISNQMFGCSQIQLQHLTCLLDLYNNCVNHNLHYNTVLKQRFLYPRNKT